MELMIVVVITGVLAAIAIPTFTGYIQKSRTSEATEFLGVIKLREEAYRAEFGQYAQQGGLASPSPDGVFAQAVPATSKSPHSASVPFPASDAFFSLIGARPDGPVRFSYGVAAGLPTVAAANVGADPYFAPTDHYFVAQAFGDLDDDGIYCTFELTSFTRGVWYSPDQGWE